jgi:PAS domain S-box-containing protein
MHQLSAKQIEELREEAAKYRSMFESATSGIFQTTADGQYRDCNPALARIYGYESPQELKDSVRDVRRQLYVEDDVRPRFIQLMAECRSGLRIRSAHLSQRRQHHLDLGDRPGRARQRGKFSLLRRLRFRHHRSQAG